MPVAVGTFVKIVASIALTVGFLWFAFATVDASSIGMALSLADPLGLLLGVASVLVATLPRACRWGLLMQGVARPRLWRITTAILAGYAANNFVPRSGEIARVLALEQRDATAGLLAVFVERVLDLLTLLVLFVFVLQVVPEKIVAAYPWAETALVTGTITTGIAVLLIIGASVARESSVDRLSHLFDRISPTLAKRISSILTSFTRGLSSIRTVRDCALILVYTILLNLCYALSVYLPFSSFGFIDRYGLGFGDAIVVMAIATIGIVIPTPGGTGTYHVFCSQALTRLYDVLPEESLAFATALHGAVFLCFLITGGPVLIRLFWRRRDAPADA